MKKYLLACLAVILALALCACGNTDEQMNEGAPGSGTADTAEKDTLNVVLSADPGSFDPHDSTGIQHLQVTRQIYETLFIRDNDGNLQPWLAESYEYENDTTLVIKLREGIYFHNGEELKASDVLFTLRRIREDSTASAMQIEPVDIEKSSVEGDYVVKIVTETPYPMLPAQLEHPLCSIISEKVYNEQGADFYGDGCVGTGPYKLVSFESGSKVNLTANDNYWVDGQPMIKNVEFSIITDASSRAIEAESGGVDIVYDISANDVDRVRAAENVNLISMVGAQTHLFTMNVTQKPFDDIRVRQAIFYALDRSELVSIACGTYGEEATGILNPGIEGRVDLTDQFVPCDVEKAKSLLAEAGYPDGITVELTSPTHDNIRMDFCEAAQAQLARAGITVNINFVEYNTWITGMTGGDFAFGQWGMTASAGEPARVLMRFLPEISESKLYGWYDDDFIALCREAMQTIDDDKRNEMFAECQRMVMDAFIAYPLWSNEINVAAQNYVKGFELQKTYSQHYLQTVYFE